MLPETLVEGHREFLCGRFVGERERYEALAETGQRPAIMIVGCVDSRVSPEVIFNAAPGELLVVRNVANLVPAYEPTRDALHSTSAALEFGTRTLEVAHVVVLGHARCGGVRAFAERLRPLSPDDFIGRWVSQVAPAAEALGPRDPADGDDDAYLERLEFASVAMSLRNLMTYPHVRARVEQGTLQLHGAYFGIAAGRLLVRNPETGRFEPVADGVPPRRALMRCG